MQRQRPSTTKPRVRPQFKEQPTQKQLERTASFKEINQKAANLKKTLDVVQKSIETLQVKHEKINNMIIKTEMDFDNSSVANTKIHEYLQAKKSQNPALRSRIVSYKYP